MESEEPALPEALEVSNEVDTIETTNELTVLKPIAYDVCDAPEAKSNLCATTDVDNHNPSAVKEDQPPDKKLSSEVLLVKISDEEDVDEIDDSKWSLKISELSPNAVPGKSRYGRVRKQKLSTDFVSVDRKSFAVLNSSSYEPARPGETPHMVTAHKKNKRSYHRRSSILQMRNEKMEDKVAENEIKDVSQTEDRKRKTESYLSANSDYFFENPLISSLNSCTIKTYSRKNEGNISFDENNTERRTMENLSAVNYTELNWKVGDIAWAKIGSYPYWPSIVTLEYGSSIYVKPVGKRGNRLAVHVQFFGDRGRRSWVLTTSLIKYASKEQFIELKRQYKKDKIRCKHFVILRQRDLWEKAILEADSILKLPNEDRIQYYQNIYPVSEETYITEMANMNKMKRPVVRRKRNPEERRGRKRKILSINQNALIRKRKRISDLSSIDSSIDAVIAASTYVGEESLSVGPKIKQESLIDDHLRKRRAFERRLNKIVKQSTRTSVVSKKKNIRNGVRLQRVKNAKFNKLLTGRKNNIINKTSFANSGGGATSPVTKEKNSNLSVYDFESDEETDVFITYNSRFTPYMMAKIDTANKKASANESESATSLRGEKDEIAETECSQPVFMPKSIPNEIDDDKREGSEIYGHGDTEQKVVSARERSKCIKNLKPKIKGDEIRIKKQRTESMGRKLSLGNEDLLDTLHTSSNKTEKRMLNDSDKKYESKKLKLHKLKKNKKINSSSECKVPLEPAQSNDQKEKENEPPKSSRKLLVTIPFDELDSDEDESKSNDTEEDLKSDEKRRSSVKKNSNIFAGLRTEKVCLICEKPGDTVRCRGPCSGTYHVSCVEKANAKEKALHIIQKRGRGRPTRKSTAILVSSAELDNVTLLPSSPTKVENNMHASQGTESIENNLKENEKSELEVKTLEIKPNSVLINVTVEKLKLEAESNEIGDNITNEVQDVIEFGNENTESTLLNDEMKHKDILPDEVIRGTVTIGKKNAIPESQTVAKNENLIDSVVQGKKTQSLENVNEKTELSTKTTKTSYEFDEAELNVKEQISSTEDNAAKQQILAEKMGKINTNVAENVNSNENVKEYFESKENVKCFDSADFKTAGDASSCNLRNATKADNSTGIEFRCNKCINNILYPCFTCGKEVQEKTGEVERYSCYLASCGRVYHKECLKAWPQATWSGNNSCKIVRNGSSVTTARETLMCPQHYCHTCISDNVNVEKNKHNNEILVRCIRCPTAYHKRVHCIPAGTEILTMSQIICPRHYELPPGSKHAHFNTNWCFICCMGGSLICCDECPTSFHAECLQLKPEEYEGRYICEDCQIGRYLLYGEVAWVKLGHYRWWPAQILYPKQVPENIQNKSHRRGEFAVEFFGSHNYNWVSRGRAFLYQEGDSGKKTCRRNSVDLSFEKAMQEAEEAYQKLKIDKAAREEEARAGLKPPRYVRIKTNKPVGNVRIVELNTSNITACECDPTSERPCAPDSDCLNRMLLVECNPLVCPAGDRCLNQAFEKRTYPPLMPYKTDKKGWGLKTLVDMKKGDFIIEYVGEMIDEEEYRRRVNTMHKNQENNYYFLTIDNHRMLDAGPKGNLSRFMNHSCDPNCETQKWTVNGDTRVGLFALKDIPANTELVFNYNLVTQGNEMKPCFCGAENCSGFIGVKAIKNGNSINEEEGRKKSNEDNKKLSINEKRRKLIRRNKNKSVRRRNHLKKIRTVEMNMESVNHSTKEILDSSSQFSENNPVVQKNEKSAKSLNAEPRFKNKTNYSMKVEALRKHRDALKRRIIQKRIKVRKEPKIETRGRKKIPRNEQEKQEMLFQMIKKRIERKYEEMSTLCSLDDICFVCGSTSDGLLFCDNNKCPKGYHLDCLSKNKWPTGRWLCPWHYCTICKSIRKVQKCVSCINSYCFLHVDNHIFVNKNGQYVCRKHRDDSQKKNVTSKKKLTIEIEDVQNDMETKQSDSTKLSKNIIGDKLDDDCFVVNSSTKQENTPSRLRQNDKTVKKMRGQIRSKTAGKKRSVQDHRFITKKSLKRLRYRKMASSCRSKPSVTDNLKSKIEIKKKIKTDKEKKDASVSISEQVNRETQKRCPSSLGLGTNETCTETTVKKNMSKSKPVRETYNETDFYVNNNGLDDEYINLEVEVINEGDSN